MPTPRKRIGFLPNVTVQDIINKISSQEKISQSKVTGILVEEALHARGIYNYNNDIKLKNNSYYKKVDEFCFDQKEYFQKGETVQVKYSNDKIDDSYSLEDYQLLNYFIEFKRFKKMINDKNKNEKN